MVARERGQGDRAIPERDPDTARVLLVFLDGVGIGPNDEEHNPFLRARLPWLTDALGAIPTLDDPSIGRAGAWSVPLDATLGIEGTPQSGTGQTALLTGANGAALFGRHFGPWIPVALRPVVEADNLLRRAVDLGRPTAFANAYPRGWSETRAGRRPAGPPLAASSAGLLNRHEGHLARREAVASEILNTGWRSRLGFSDLPSPTPEEAGATLARVAADHELTLFAHYSTDHAGHRGGMAGATRALERVDRFLSGLVDRVPARTLVVVASDHGNVEDVRRGHTRNPALGLIVGPHAADRAASLRSIMDVPHAVLGWLPVTGDP